MIEAINEGTCDVSPSCQIQVGTTSLLLKAITCAVPVAIDDRLFGFVPYWTTEGIAQGSLGFNSPFPVYMDRKQHFSICSGCSQPTKRQNVAESLTC
jgi:hypothetical protein